MTGRLGSNQVGALQSTSMEPSEALWGSQAQILSVSSVSSLHEIGFIYPPASSLSSKGKVQTVTNQGGEGI